MGDVPAAHYLGATYAHTLSLTFLRLAVAHLHAYFVSLPRLSCTTRLALTASTLPGTSLGTTLRRHCACYYCSPLHHTCLGRKSCSAAAAAAVRYLLIPVALTPFARHPCTTWAPAFGFLQLLPLSLLLQFTRSQPQFRQSQSSQDDTPSEHSSLWFHA